MAFITILENIQRVNQPANNIYWQQKMGKLKLFIKYGHQEIFPVNLQ